MSNTIWSKQVCEEVHSREKYKHMPMEYRVAKVDSLELPDREYRVFIWNLGKLIVYYSGLF